MALLFALSPICAEKITPITPDNATIGFKGKARPAIVGKGIFESFKGQLVWSDDQRQLLRAEGTIDAKSLNSKNKMRDKHLSRTSMLNVEEHPTLAFKSTSITQDGDTYHVVGDFTMRGSTQSIAFDLVKVKDEDGSPMLKGDITLNRFAFGLKGYKYQIRKKVYGKVEISL